MNKLGWIKNKKAQAVAETALFGSIILFIFGVLLSQLQRLNDQQYVQMSAFRRALERANSGLDRGVNSTNSTILPEDGAGASVQYSLTENRKYTELQGGYRKGNTQALSASSSVFWAVPKVGEQSESLMVYKVNEDENVYNYTDFVPKEHDKFDDQGKERQRFWEFQPLDASSDSEAHFNETAAKEENPAGITNRVTSELRERVHTRMPYRVVEKDKDDKNYEKEIPGLNGTLVDFDQHLYRDTDGQYKFDKDLPPGNRTVIRGKQWETRF